MWWKPYKNIYCMFCTLVKCNVIHIFVILKIVYSYSVILYTSCKDLMWSCWFQLYIKILFWNLMNSMNVSNSYWSSGKWNGSRMLPECCITDNSLMKRPLIISSMLESVCKMKPKFRNHTRWSLGITKLVMTIYSLNRIRFLIRQNW